MESIFSSLVTFVVAMVTTAGLVPQAAAQREFTPEFQGRVVHVDDGDTVVVLRADGQKTKVRLANIDAPETHHGRCRPGQPFGQKSGQALKQMVLGKQLTLTCSTLDRYDRHVCDLSMGQTTANREMARMGLAWANRARASYLRDQEVVRAEQEARSQRRGFWADGRAVEPWQWRKEQWFNGCS